MDTTTKRLIHRADIVTAVIFATIAICCINWLATPYLLGMRSLLDFRFPVVMVAAALVQAISVPFAIPAFEYLIKRHSRTGINRIASRWHYGCADASIIARAERNLRRVMWIAVIVLIMTIVIMSTISVYTPDHTIKIWSSMASS